MGLFSRHKHNNLPPAASGPPAYSPSPAPSSQYAPPSPPKQPVNPDSRPLPQGWISQYDPSTKRFFYVYTPTALRQWEHPMDKPLNAAPPAAPSPNPSNRGESASYYSQPAQHQQPYYPQQAQQPYYPQQQQRFYPQQMQPQYVMAGGSRPMMGGGGGMGFGKMAAAGIGGGLLGSMLGNAMFDRPDTTIIEENNYYDNDYNNFDGGGDFGGGDFGGGDFGGGFGGDDFF